MKSNTVERAIKTEIYTRTEFKKKKKKKKRVGKLGSFMSDVNRALDEKQKFDDCVSENILIRQKRLSLRNLFSRSFVRVRREVLQPVETNYAPGQFPFPFHNPCSQ